MASEPLTYLGSYKCRLYYLSADEFESAGIKSVERIGDALAAGALVHAVHSGHSYARQLDRPTGELYLRDIPVAEHPPARVI